MVAGTTCRSGNKRKKSRKGCGNCKLRSVKCDERKPGCVNCASYGVICSYNRAITELQPSTGEVRLVVSPKDLGFWPSIDEELLAKFRVRTAATISIDRRLALFQNELSDLGYSVPCLKHGIQTLTLMHDRHLHFNFNPSLSLHEAKSWLSLTSAFRNQLEHPLNIEQQAAVWATSAILGVLVFCNVDASVPQDAWPLRPSSPFDLDWLRMSDGKKQIYSLTKSLGTDSTFHPLLGALPIAPSPSRPVSLGSESVTLAFTEAYSLDHTYNNPYHSAAFAFARIFPPDTPWITMMFEFLSLVSNMNPILATNLGQKDPLALLLLACWYARLCRLDVWWLQRRTILEGTAICLYLSDHCSDQLDEKMRTVLTYPATVFGINHETLV